MPQISRAPSRARDEKKVITYVKQQINGQGIGQLGSTLRQLRMTPYELISICQRARSVEASQIRRAVMRGISDGQLDTLDITEKIVLDLSKQVDALIKQWVDLRSNLKLPGNVPGKTAEIATEIQDHVAELNARWEELCGVFEVAADTAPAKIVEAVKDLQTTLESLGNQSSQIDPALQDEVDQWRQDAARIPGLERQVTTLTGEKDQALRDKSQAEAAKGQAEAAKAQAEAAKAQAEGEKEQALKDKTGAEAKLPVLRGRASRAESNLAEREKEVAKLQAKVAKLSGATRFARARYRLACWINSLTDPWRHLKAFIELVPDANFKAKLEDFVANKHFLDIRQKFDNTKMKDVLGSDAKLWELYEKAYHETVKLLEPTALSQLVTEVITLFAQTAIWVFPSIIQISKMPPPGLPAAGEIDEDAATREYEVDLNKPEISVELKAGGRDGTHISRDKKTALITITGRVRDHNEDGFLRIVAKDQTSGDVIAELFVVADGMGGQGAGEGQEAAEVALKAIRDVWDPNDPNSVLIGIQKAVEELCRRPHLTRVHAGTCMTIMHKTQDKTFVWNLGDTRAIHKRGKDIQQITLDNSLATELFAMEQYNQFYVPLRGDQVKAFWDSVDDCPHNNVVRNGIVAKQGSRTFVGYLEKTWFGKHQDNIWKALIDSQCIRDDKEFINGRSIIDIKFNEKKVAFAAAMGVSPNKRIVEKVFDILQKSTRHEIDTQPGDTFYLFSDGLGDLTKRVVQKTEIEAIFGSDTSWQAFFHDSGQKQYFRSHIDGAAIDETLIRSKIPADKVDAFLALWQPHQLTNFDRFVEIASMTTAKGQPLRADQVAKQLMYYAEFCSSDNSTVAVVEA